MAMERHVFIAPELRDPERYHTVILHHYLESAEGILARRLADDLQNWICDFQYDIPLEKTCQISCIEAKNTYTEAIECSRKVIIMVTKSYLRSIQMNAITKVAINWAEDLKESGRIMSILCDCDLRVDDLPKALQSFNVMSRTDDNLASGTDNKFLTKLCNFLLSSECVHFKLFRFNSSPVSSLKDHARNKRTVAAV